MNYYMDARYDKIRDFDTYIHTYAYKYLLFNMHACKQSYLLNLQFKLFIY